MINTLNNVDTEGTYLNIIKDIHDKPIANNIHNGEKLREFPLRSGIRQKYPPMPLLFNIILKVLPRTIKKRK